MPFSLPLSLSLLARRRRTWRKAAKCGSTATRRPGSTPLSESESKVRGQDQVVCSFLPLRCCLGRSQPNRFAWAHQRGSEKAISALGREKRRSGGQGRGHSIGHTQSSNAEVNADVGAEVRPEVSMDSGPVTDLSSPRSGRSFASHSKEKVGGELMGGFWWVLIDGEPASMTRTSESWNWANRFSARKLEDFLFVCFVFRVQQHLNIWRNDSGGKRTGRWKQRIIESNNNFSYIPQEINRSWIPRELCAQTANCRGVRAVRVLPECCVHVADHISALTRAADRFQGRRHGEVLRSRGTAIGARFHPIW